jgi:choline dehydrogenase-like flavoprotein
MPTVVAGNTNATALMIGRKIATFLAAERTEALATPSAKL